MQIIELKDPPKVEELVERFGRRRHAFILDSAQSNDGLGNWSFFGADPYKVLSGKDGVYASGCESKVSDGLALLRDELEAHSVENSSGIPFVGGAVGFLAYDYGRQLEALSSLAQDDRSIPDLHFGFYDGVVALNMVTGVLYLIALGVRDEASVILGELESIVRTPVEAERPQSPFKCGDWVWNFNKEAYQDAVEAVRAFIASGDVYQVNLSQRARAPFEGDPVGLFQALRAGNPAPYGAYLDTGGLKLISTSPEQFLSKRGNTLMTRPIKGTRPRTGNLQVDLVSFEDLKNSAKDRAELLMIVDLERNDLGKVAEFGSVKVKNLYQLEAYKGVLHQTAQVEATLREGLDVIDCLRATFPGGSITGAPKVRAMEIIEALEPTRRGAYCGSIGYAGFDGNAEFNIAIRSLHMKDGYLDYQVGAGIVWDSDAESEFEETLDKGRAIRDTINRLTSDSL